MSLHLVAKPWELLVRQSNFRWGTASKARIDTCHEDLRRLFNYVILHPGCPFDLTIPATGAVRSPAEQQQEVDEGDSQTLNSRHVAHKDDGLSRALDVVPYVQGRARFSDWSRMRQLAPHVFACAHDLGIPIEWGGNWVNFPDGAHWQLPWVTHP